MSALPPVVNDNKRLAALDALHIMDTPPEVRYDRITRLAQRLLGSPIALVSFIDDKRQWFKSRQGAQAAQLPLQGAICIYTLAAPDGMIVEDALLDPRVNNNPLVTSAPKIRSYAGHAIHAEDGSPIGTLCVMDLKPRTFSEDDRAVLADLAALVEDELRLGTASEAINQEAKRLKAVEAALARQALVFENLTEAVLVTDREGQIIDCNPAAERLYGYMKHEMIGQTADLWEKVPRTSLQKKLISGSLDQRRAWTGEMRFVHRGGREGMAEIAIQPLINEDGAVFGRIEVSHDVTQRKRIDQQLKTALSVQQATFESSAEGIVVVDQSERMANFNRVFREMWNFPEDIIASRNVNQAVRFALDQMVEPEAFLYVVQHTYAKHEEVATGFTELKDGRVIEYYTQLQRLDLVIIGRIWNFRDVTARRAAEQQIRQQNESLIQANRELAIARQEADEANALKGQFLATISHELRTPLNAIIGFAQLQTLGVSGELNAEQLSYEERIIKNGHYLLSLIDELLDLSKLEAGRLDLINQSFDLRKFLDDVIRHNRVLADNKGLTVDLQVDPAMPMLIVGDQARMQQIVLNLFSNAVKFTSSGAVTITVQPGMDHHWLLTVSDTGIGIPEDKQAMIFEEFRQVDQGPTRRYGGTGLGLAIVKRLVQLMGGTVRVNSIPEKGSTFIVTLPLVTGMHASTN